MKLASIIHLSFKTPVHEYIDASTEGNELFARTITNKEAIITDKELSSKDYKVKTELKKSPFRINSSGNVYQHCIYTTNISFNNS